MHKLIRGQSVRIRMNRLTPRKLVWQICVALLLILLNTLPAASQDKRAKVRISNAGFTITALPLLAAKDWGIFNANGLDVELIVMSPSIAAAADGPRRYRLCRRCRSGVGRRDIERFAIARDLVFLGRISYWLQSAVRRTRRSAGSQRQKDRHLGRRGGTNHVALLIALEKSGVQLERLHDGRHPRTAAAGLLLARIRLRRRRAALAAASLSAPRKKDYNKIMDVGAMVEMPGGGLTTMIKTIQARPAEVKRVIHALQSAKDEVRKSKPKTVELIMKLLKDGQRSRRAKPTTRFKQR